MTQIASPTKRSPRIAIDPGAAPWVVERVREGGATIVEPNEAEALVWSSPYNTAGLRTILADNAQIGWVQLPFAGIENWLAEGFCRDGRRWTCGKGVYAEPVAEHVLALALAGMRHIGHYAQARSWGEKLGTCLLDAEVLCLGGGGITESLLRLLQPFGCKVTVLRNRPGSSEFAERPRQVGPDTLHSELPRAALVVIALALTPETTGLIGAPELLRMRPDAWLVNVGRGAHVVTDALVDALREERIGGAALDVTDPEPLPEGHPLWGLPNCIITPHTANTPEMAKGPLGARIRENVRRFTAGEPLIGLVDPHLGY